MLRKLRVVLRRHELYGLTVLRSRENDVMASAAPLAGVRIIECSLLGAGALATHLVDLDPGDAGDRDVARVGERCSAWSGSMRVTSTFCPARASSRATPEICSHVFPCPRITSGAPCRSALWWSTVA